MLCWMIHSFWLSLLYTIFDLSFISSISLETTDPFKVDFLFIRQSFLIWKQDSVHFGWIICLILTFWVNIRLLNKTAFEDKLSEIGDL